MPKVQLSEGIDLLIHGVSGTQPQAMLDVQDVVLVAGNKLSGFYRRNPVLVAAPDPVSTRPLEAFSWGGFTSGAASRALWLLLLPFGLVNAASWMHPATASRATPWQDTGVRAYQAILRVFALSLTVMFFIGAAGLVVDMLAWKSPKGADDLTRPLGLGVGGMTLLLGLTWMLSRRMWRRYDAVAEPPGAGEGAPTTPLMRAAFWGTKQTVRRLRLAHVMAGSATIVLAATGPLAVAGLARPASGICSAVAVALVVMALVLVVRTDLGKELDGVVVRSLLATWVARLSYGFAVGVVGWLLRSRPVPRGATVAMPGYHRVLTAAIAVQVLLLLALLVVTALLVRSAQDKDDSEPSALGGYMGPAFAAVAWIAGGLFATAATIGAPFVARVLPSWVHAPGFVKTLGQRAQQPDLTFLWESINALVLLTVLGITGAIVVRRRSRLHREAIAASVTADYAGAIAPSWLTLIRKARFQASLTDVAPTLVATLTVAGMLSMSAGLVVAAIGERPPHALSVASAVLVGIATVLLVIGGYFAFKRGGIRRVVGIVWDLATFWPRSVHPFSPPCYAERAVPQLLERIRASTGAGGTVIVSAHSQGTVIAAAVVFRLAPADRARVALLTYGSPLRRLYTRMFPAYFGPTALGDLAGGLRTSSGVRWRNLWRATDPIGGPIAGPTADDGTPLAPPAPALAGIDVRLAKDPALLQVPGDIDEPSPDRHSDYGRDAGFAASVAELGALLPH
ncbi:MAG: putative integral rane protein [Frankiales bacterium]|nr:putative integral rane protein [Frankiales bacterium]